MFTYYNPQLSVDKINNQIAELEKMKSQIPMQQPTNLTQNFQIASPNASLLKYADSIEDVKKDLVIGDTPYFSKDMTILWIKNIQGNIKTYSLEEIIEKDAKDIQIEILRERIKELEAQNESINDATVESIEDEESSNIQTSGRTKKK